jgi:pimeloyl-ACP methyl ester carboxylesterase
MPNLVLADGRSLEYVTGGPADGLPLVLHHGTPSAAVLYAPMVESAAQAGLRTVVHSRPGYAGSSPQPGRTVAAVAADMAAILDDLGAADFVTIGWSGGGPHALACAALLPGRCRAAATIAAVAPYAAAGLDWLAGMGNENVEEFGAAAAGEPVLTAFLADAAGELAHVQAAQISAAMGDLVSEVDREVLTGDFAGNLAESLRAALSTGIAGWRDDDLAFLTGWGFDLAEIVTPVSIWQGAEDRMVPYAHGQWLAARMPRATVHLDPAEGHLSLLLNAFDVVLAELTSDGG